MIKITLSAIAILTMASPVTVSLSADEGFSLLGNAKFNGEIRPRYETVDDESTASGSAANAMTVRAVLGLEAQLLGIEGLSGKVEGTTVQSIGGEHYYSVTNSRSSTAYDTIADPQQSRITQAYLHYKLNKTTAKVGRQIINIDNQRFVGSVDWRQMPQVFDAALISDNTIDALTLTGAYVWGRDLAINNNPTSKTNSIILNGSYKVSDMLKITAYDYMISSASDTVGIALTGTLPFANAKVAYRAEYASQGDASRDTDNLPANQNVQADAYYYNLDLKADMNGFFAGAGYEFLSGTTTTDGKTKFQTPLATLHAFNGWADKFLATPTGGLKDTSVTLGYSAAGLGKAMVVYHDFATDVEMGGKSDLGNEWDLLYTNAIPGVKGLNALVKAAFYNAGDVNPTTTYADTDKIWLQLDYKF
ncbi:hypothetical protein Sulku_1382 [Sulfuricurvum kujiense DSM 16994]|uniref:Alginate export domain-containing protein n=1 Tax=Sulfuricurvum kujiense (strain ATCC BAA-921 / DSM 16994 / JCM 11577 / YK-1) TaxID=709032 RepID=E4TYQ3_SULKY|nr:alginate export family protein [Sulfuricurvum kujiense]ADR34044.1 hypothetical protein Sulku_1382 [Sulfuricurvum kujiense DSM 16994]